MLFATMLGALLFCKARKTSENSESVAREGWTDTITSLERYAMRATTRKDTELAEGYW
jgi:hypothetical protein